MKELVEGMKVRVRHLRHASPYLAAPMRPDGTRAELGTLVSIGLRVEPFGYASKHGLKALGLTPAARGGMTIVELFDPDTSTTDLEGHGVVARGTAVCSESENYVKKAGRELALERAVAQLHEGQQENREA